MYAAHYAHFIYLTNFFLPANEAIAKFRFCLIRCENFHNICQRADPGKSFKVFFTACHDFCLPRLANKTFFQHVEPGGWTKCSLVRQLNLHFASLLDICIKSISMFVYACSSTSSFSSSSSYLYGLCAFTFQSMWKVLWKISPADDRKKPVKKISYAKLNSVQKFLRFFSAGKKFCITLEAAALMNIL